jgi:DNA-binding NarL/FixJ family response regulator
VGVNDSIDEGAPPRGGEGGPATPRRRGAILVVESNPMLRDYLPRLLRSRFPLATIIAAESEHDALPRLHVGLPDVVFVHAPPGDGRGFELIRRLRQAAPSARIVFLSDCDEPEYREAALRCGADHYLEKGAARIDDLVGLVRTANGFDATA